MDTSANNQECHPAQKLINSVSPYDSYAYKPYPVQQKIETTDPLYQEYQKQAALAAKPSVPQKAEDPSQYDIKKATQFGAFERVKELVDGGYDVKQLDSEGVSLLHWAAINNKKAIAKLYLEHGAEIDKRGGVLDSTPLHWATRQGHLPMVVFLVCNGADPAALDGEGYQCIHLASMFSHSSIVAYFIAKGYDVDTLDKTGMTPLMWACYRTASTDPIRLLINLGADVNKKDTSFGHSPLHWAMLVGNHTAFGQLSKHNLDLNALNLAGQTAYDVAVQKGNKWLSNKIAKLRVERGFDNPGYFPARTIHNKEFRTKCMIFYPFFALWAIGWAFEVDYWWTYWWIRLLLLGAVFLSFKYSKRYLFDERFAVTVPFGLYLATKLWMYFTWFFYAFNYIDSVIIHGMFLLNSALLIYHFYKAVTNDPGYIKPSRQEQYQTILSLAEKETITLEQFCSTCLIHKPLRSKHCSICDKCVAKFDHHCPWIYNCVGVGNMKHFILYLSYLIGMILWCMYGCVTSADCVVVWRHGCQYPEGSHRVGVAISCSPWVSWIFLNSCAHLVFVGILLTNLLYQALYLGLTTNEKLNLYRYKHFKKDGAFHNPYHRGVVQNCVDELECHCFGLCRPAKTNWQTMYNQDAPKSVV